MKESDQELPLSPDYHGRVLHAASTDARSSTQRARAFWWRFADNAFRHWVWLAMPVIAFVMIGLIQASGTAEVYKSTATLSASSNPLAPEESGSSQLSESTAAAISRSINERLQTDSFLLAVLDQAGLGDDARAGRLDLIATRDHILAEAGGDAILTINVEWDDPQTSQRLAAATIGQFEQLVDQHIAQTLASDASEAESFYATQLEARQADRDVAEQELESYLATLPALPTGVDPSVEVQVDIDRLSNRLTAAEAQVGAAQASLDDATLARTQLVSQIDRSVTVIDPPQVPDTAEPVLVRQAATVIGFTLLGLILVLGALLLTTALDSSVVSTLDLIDLPGIGYVTTIPTLALPSTSTTEATGLGSNPPEADR